MTRAREEGQADRRPPSTLSVLARIYWMLFGYFPIAVSAASAAGVPEFPAPIDALYWASVVVLIGVRYWDVARLGGETADGDPATIQHWRRFSLRAIGFALLLWGSVRALARFTAE